MNAKLLVLAFLLAAQVSFGQLQKREGFQWDMIESLAIQDRGRLKPFDTFARESVLYVTGKSSWKGLSAVEVVWGWLLAFEEEYKDESFIRVDYKPLKEKLGLEVKNQFFRFDEIRDLETLDQAVRQASDKQMSKERLSELDKKALELQNKVSLVESVITATSLALLPNPKNQDEAWFTLADFINKRATPYEVAAHDKFGLVLEECSLAFRGKKADEWNRCAPTLKVILRDELAKGNYPSAASLNREIHYNHFRPFRWAWVGYTLALVALILGLVGDRKVFKQTGVALLFVSFGIHTYGFVLRCLISGRPPVTNMYESVVWVSWGCILFALMIWGAYKNIIIPAAALVFSIAGLVLADNLPSVLDPGIHPLVPVLRSNFWLTIHVLCITLSYAAFAVATCLGNLNLGMYIFKPQEAKGIQQNILFMYRGMQIGVILLAAGTILGGVWADYSWGRFWGWDPKEVWALIALLFYIAVLHGRFTGWLKGFGFVATTVLSFLGVVMAWYGVNFVLGVGLHSYGFGSGGLSYVLTYLVLQIAFIGISYYRYVKVGKPGNNYVAPRTGI
ncbi:MAG: cytochrome C biogenesis protein [Proteobacteria bacterium]|nr:cytochrome C biogenesis protein [Pseudomonadota bacterium]